MASKWKFWLAAVLLAAGTGAARATPITGADVMGARLGARPAALGDAYVALGDDVFSVQYNPASLAGLGKVDVAFLHWSAIADVSYEYFAWGQGFDFGSLSFSGVYRHMPDINNSGAVDPPVSSNDLLLSLSYSHGLDDLLPAWIPDIYRKSSGGLSLKFLKSVLGSTTAYTAALDLGGRLQVREGLTAGVSLLNLGPGIHYISTADPLPATLLAGLAERLKWGEGNEFNITADVEQSLVDTSNLATLAVLSHFGVEAVVGGALALRVGYSVGALQSLMGLTGGIGIRLDQQPLVFQVDYAYRPVYYGAGIQSGLGTYLGNSEAQHILSLGLSF